VSVAQPWRIPPQALADIQLCLEAARLRARGMAYPKIAEKIGLAKPEDARLCAERGYGLAQEGEDLRLARNRAAAALNQAMESIWETIDSPGYAVAPNGKIVCDPDGEPMPDKATRVAAQRVLLEALKQDRVLHGTDAPKRSISLIGSLPEQELDAAIRERENELKEMRRQAELEGKLTVLPGVVDDAEAEATRERKRDAGDR
jgi:hypothetical protein